MCEKQNTIGLSGGKSEYPKGNSIEEDEKLEILLKIENSFYFKMIIRRLVHSKPKEDIGVYSSK